MNKRKLKKYLKTIIQFLGNDQTFSEFYKSYQKQLENIQNESLANIKFNKLLENWYEIAKNESNQNLSIKDKIIKLQLLSMHII